MDSVVRNICSQIQQAGSFAIIVDGTKDMSRKEQMSICIRYVDNDLCPHEEFLDLYEPPDTTGEVLAKCVLDVQVIAPYLPRMRPVSSYLGSANEQEQSKN